MQQYRNQVEERGPVLLISLTMEKKALADNNDFVRGILCKYRFGAIRRRLADGSDAYYAVSVSAATGRNYLHRLVLGPAVCAGQNVCHRDGNTLNCCADNLVAKSTRAMLADAKKLRNPVVGIFRRSQGWIVLWTDRSGARHYRLFSFRHNEPAQAYELAVAYRISMHAGALCSRK